MTKHSAQPIDHRQQSAAEIHQAIVALAERRRVLLNAAYEISRARKGAPEPEITKHDLAVRAHAAKLLNGSAPPEMLSPPATSREERIKIEVEALDLVVGVFSGQYDAALQREAEEWVIQHAAEWRMLARETVLVAARLFSLEERARDMIEAGLKGRSVGGLAMARHVGASTSLLGTGDPLRELRDAAIAEGIVSRAEIKKAQEV